MRRSLFVVALCVAVSCTPKHPASGPIPVNPPDAPPPPPAAPPPSSHQSVRLGPNTLRYVMHQVIHIDQDFQGMHQPLDFGLRAFFAATITGPADSSGYPTTITVDSTGIGRQRLTAILVVDDGSGDRACRQRASASTLINATPLPPVGPHRFDEFPSIAFDDDKARLDNLAIELQNNPGATGYIIVYGGRNARTDTADRLGGRARDYLVQTRGIDANRVVVVNGGYRDTNSFELWLVPQGAAPPAPTPTIRPGDVRPATAAPRRTRRP